MPSKDRSVLSSNPLYRQVSRLADHMEFGLNCMLFNVIQTKKAAICGMGACALAGEVVSEYMDGNGGRPVPLVKGVELPKWADKDTTVILISYSGQTRETLHCYSEAMRRGCQVVAITSGGKLEDLCLKDGNPLVAIPGGMQSRGAVGYMIGMVFAVLKAIGFLNSFKDIIEVLPALREHTSKFLSTDDNEAKAIAEECFGKIPVIYSYFNMRSAAVRWKSGINENSKNMAYCGTLPEFNHNELVGWMSDSVDSRLFPIILVDEDVSDMLKYMVETPVGMLRDVGIEVYEYHVKGASLLEKTLKSFITGDFVSLYLGYLNSEVSITGVVDDMKSINDSITKHSSRRK